MPFMADACDQILSSSLQIPVLIRTLMEFELKVSRINTTFHQLKRALLRNPVYFMNPVTIAVA